MRIVSNKARLCGTVHVPPSKSLSNRALMIQAYLSDVNAMPITNVSSGTDTQVMQSCLEAVRANKAHTDIQCRDAGTVFRFILPLLAMQSGRTFTLTGTKRLLQRPIKPLLEALGSLGASIQENADGTLFIEGKPLHGGTLPIDASQSSQFVSALCMAAPVLPGGLRIELKGQRVSFPYIRMTLNLMAYFGIQFQEEAHAIVIPEQAYTPKAYRVENDWSSASFYYAMAMFCGEVDMTLPGLGLASLQGDAYVAQLATHFGIETSVVPDGLRIARVKPATTPSSVALRLDFTDYPDLAVPFIVACAALYPSLPFTGIQHLNLKESERLQALQQELKKVGYTLKYEQGVLTTTHESTVFKHSLFNLCTYHDHRLAMAFAALAFTGKVIVIDDATCVRKSYPAFWGQLAELQLSVY